MDRALNRRDGRYGDTWSPRGGGQFRVSISGHSFQGLCGWNPAGTASKPPGNMGWMHIPLRKEDLKIFGVSRKNARVTQLCEGDAEMIFEN